MGKTHKIGNHQDFIRYCNLVDQFCSGDFLCIDNAFLPQNIESIELLTEDDQFRPIACEGILLEVQALDTSFFAIYSENQEIQNVISRAFDPLELIIGQTQADHGSKNADTGKLISDLGMNLAEDDFFRNISDLMVISLS